jgi:hypothetical protein
MFRRAIFLQYLCLAMLAGCASSPPVQEMSDARQAITAAEEAEAATSAPEMLGEARRFLAQAERALRDESYGSARINAVRAKNRAVAALEIAEATGLRSN